MRLMPVSPASSFRGIATSADQPPRADDAAARQVIPDSCVLLYVTYRVCLGDTAKLHVSFPRWIKTRKCSSERSVLLSGIRSFAGATEMCAAGSSRSARTYSHSESASRRTRSARPLRGGAASSETAFALSHDLLVVLPSIS